jgi:CMP-N,N'-diacetyllegionaminic acid synthase
MEKIVAIIPARSGSKSVKNKNIRLMNHKPMLAYSIEHARQSQYINRIIVSTDSEEYAKIARSYGAETPFIRPVQFAADTSLDIDVFLLALKYLEKTENYIPDIVVQLRPTYPIRNVAELDQMIALMMNDKTIDSVRSMAVAEEVAHKMWYQNPDGTVKPILTDIPEAYNLPRQSLPKILYQNANVDVIRTDVITIQHSMSGKKIIGFEMKDNFDIDTEKEFLRAEEYLKIISGKQRFVFDIDGVIAIKREDLDYSLARPNEEMIQIINRLYDFGNEIVLFTARGFVTKKDWYAITEKQMADWHVKYHDLLMGKPNADYYVDDKNLSLDFLYQEFGKIRKKDKK